MSAPWQHDDYAGTVPAEVRSTRLGWVALTIGVVALVGPLAHGCAVYERARAAGVDSSEVVTVLSDAISHGLAAWFLVGLWAIIQGVVALSTKRGVGQGLTAIGLGAVGPWLGLLVPAILLHSL